MKKNFFEGKDFGKGQFKALMPEYYPSKYKKYIQEEITLLQSHLKGTKRVLEAGVGIGRLIPELAPLVTEFVGIDNTALMLKEAKKVAERFPKARIIKGNLENVSKLFPENYFDYAVCVWNTLGNMKDEVRVLQEVAKVTKKSIFITVYRKGTLEDRKRWYKAVGIRISRIDERNEIFYSESGLRSKSYTLEEIKKIAKASDLKVTSSRVLAGVILWVELKKK